MTTDEHYSTEAKMLDRAIQNVREALDCTAFRDEMAERLGPQEALMYQLRVFRECQAVLRRQIEPLAIDLVTLYGVSQRAVGAAAGYSGTAIGSWVREAQRDPDLRASLQAERQILPKA